MVKESVLLALNFACQVSAQVWMVVRSALMVFAAVDLSLRFATSDVMERAVVGVKVNFAGHSVPHVSGRQETVWDPRPKPWRTPALTGRAPDSWPHTATD